MKQLLYLLISGFFICVKYVGPNLTSCTGSAITGIYHDNSDYIIVTHEIKIGNYHVIIMIIIDITLGLKQIVIFTIQIFFIHNYQIVEYSFSLIGI